MKKKKGIYRILAFVFCSMFLLLAGCDPAGGLGGSGSDAVAVLDGTKVLSRPSGYSFSNAVGEFSEHYYNLYAANILRHLYEGYEGFSNESGVQIAFDGDIINGTKPGFLPLQGDNTYGKFVGANEKLQYYLYESLRYTIESVERVESTQLTVDKDGFEYPIEIITLDLSKSWNWKIKDEAGASGKDDILFKKIPDPEKPNSYTKNENKVHVTMEVINSWTNEYALAIAKNQFPDFKDSYIGDQVTKVATTIPDQDEITNYYKSPFYETQIEGNAESTAKNYFQDALEYVIYMFVLGYDYHTYDDDGNVKANETNEADAPYFDFKFTFSADGYVNAMTVTAVPGRTDSNVPVVDALKFAKDKYNEIGGYVGVTEKNIQQITRFILEKVIGDNSPSEVSVKTINSSVNEAGVKSSTEGDPIVLERNYNAIVNNIVRYACAQAPIGVTINPETSEYEFLSLSNSFPASMITEYRGNYFFANYETVSDGVQINDDSDLFKNIEAAEYQSLVIYPSKDLIGKTLGDLWLDFEYFENTNESKVMLDELVINVGFRYYDHKQNKVVVDQQEQMKITYGKNGTLKDKDGEDISDQSMFLIGEGEDGPYNVKLEEGSVEFREFKNDIGGGVLNPFASGTVIDPAIIKASKYLSGLDNARKYYKLNNSKTSGQYGTLNEAMFAGDDGCSFIEVYFDIEKDPSRDNVNYDFKVCFRTVTEHQDADSMPDIDDEDFDDEDF